MTPPTWLYWPSSSNLVAATGGTEATTFCGYKYHVFNSSGTFTVTTGGTIDILVVGGGGGGSSRAQTTGAGGAGGAGAMIEHSATLAAGDYTVTVGAGGAGGQEAVGTNGSNSSFINSTGTAISITATGGGGGGWPFANVANQRAKSGGSGGGAGSSEPTQTGSADTYSGTGTKYGNAGGQGGGTHGQTSSSSGGGGGAGGAGGNGAASVGGAGGKGREWLNGNYYAGGGGGGATTTGIGIGGLGGGANGGSTATPTAATANTGGGGGGSQQGTGGAGGSGVVILRYADSSTTSEGGTWLPTDLTDLLVWYDATDTDELFNAATGGSNVTTDGSDVGRWEPSGGSLSLNYANTSTTSRPKYETNEFNDLAMIKGTSDYLGKDNQATICTDVAGFTAFMVVRPDKASANQDLLMITRWSHNGIRFTLEQRSDNKYRVSSAPGQNTSGNDTGTDINVTNGTAARGTTVVLGGVADIGTKLLLSVNGTTYEQTTFGTVGHKYSNVSPQRVGFFGNKFGAATYEYSIGEVIMLNKAVSTADREKIEGYLAHRWGLAINLPAAHPYKHCAP